MEQAIELLKVLLLPKLQKDVRFDITKTNGAFWEQMTVAFLDFEKDVKPTQALLYSLELDTIEKILDQLPNIYLNFIKELAERFVLGITDQATSYLKETNNATFLKEVTFYKTLQQAIKHVERNRIKTELSKTLDRLTFELSETDISTVVKKKGRDDLKAKFKNWDAEIASETPVVSMLTSSQESRTKVISLSWIKYAVAACVVITGGVLYFKFSQPTIDGINQPQQNNVVIKEKSKAVPTDIIPDATYITTSSKLNIEYPSSLGFTGSTVKSITILFKDASASIKTLRSQIKEEISGKNNTGVGPLKEKLHSLESKQNTYEFDGKQLTVYSEKTKETMSIMTIDDKVFYLKRGKQYTYLYFTKIPLLFQPVKDAAVIEQLEKISFENE
jgi:hypothetical protein